MIIQPIKPDDLNKVSAESIEDQIAAAINNALINAYRHKNNLVLIEKEHCGASSVIIEEKNSVIIEKVQMTIPSNEFENVITEFKRTWKEKLNVEDTKEGMKYSFLMF